MYLFKEKKTDQLIIFQTWDCALPFYMCKGVPGKGNPLCVVLKSLSKETSDLSLLGTVFIFCINGKYVENMNSVTVSIKQHRLMPRWTTRQPSLGSEGSELSEQSTRGARTSTLIISVL